MAAKCYNSLDTNFSIPLLYSFRNYFNTYCTISIDQCSKLKQMLQCSTLLEFSGNCDKLLKNPALWYKLTIIIWNKPFHNAANVKCSQFEKIWIRLMQVFEIRQNRAQFNFQEVVIYQKMWRKLVICNHVGARHCRKPLGRGVRIYQN